MFTGLVEEVGRVKRVLTRRGNRLLTIEAGFAAEVAVGESVSVEGCCLTAVEAGERTVVLEAVGSTLKQTTLDGLRAGSEVNLERALALSDRLGGHFVQGHVDETATVRRVDRESGYWRTEFRVSSTGEQLLIERGSVCVNGVSLTIASRRAGAFTVNVIPHTWESTTLHLLRAGDRVNVEYDMLVKAVRRSLGRGE